MHRQWCSAQCLKTNSLGKANKMIYRVFFSSNFHGIHATSWPISGYKWDVPELWEVLQLALVSLYKLVHGYHLSEASMRWTTATEEPTWKTYQFFCFRQPLTMEGSLRKKTFISNVHFTQPLSCQITRIRRMGTWDFGPRTALVPVSERGVAGATHSSLLVTSLEWILKSNTLRPSIFYTRTHVHAHTHTSEKDT